MLKNNIKINMKRIYKKLIMIFCMLIIGLILNCSTSNAANASLSASSLNVNVGDNVTVTVSANGCIWQLKVSGAGVSDTMEHVDTNLVNQSDSKTYTVDTSSAGTKTVTLSGSVIDADRTEVPVNQTINITVSEKPAQPAEQGNTNNAPVQEPVKQIDPTFTNTNIIHIFQSL